MHIGWGLWWFIPSSFALFIIFLFQRNKKNFFNAFFPPLLTFIVSLPIILFYIFADNSFAEDEFFKNYWYGVNNSIVELILNNKIELFYYFSTLLIVFLGYSILKEKEINIIKNEKIIYIILGVFFIFFTSFIFVDYLNSGTVSKLQLLRSFELITFFFYFFRLYLLSSS